MIPQHEFEAAMYKLLAYGDETELAKAVGKSPAYYSSMLNPEDPRESIWFRAARDFGNLMAIDPERGRAALDLFCFFAKRALPGDDKLDLMETRKRAWAEDLEARLSEIDADDIQTIIREYEESHNALGEHINAWRAEEKRRRRAGILEAVTNGRRAS